MFFLSTYITAQKVQSRGCRDISFKALALKPLNFKTLALDRVFGDITAIIVYRFYRYYWPRKGIKYIRYLLIENVYIDVSKQDSMHMFDVSSSKADLRRRDTEFGFNLNSKSLPVGSIYKYVRREPCCVITHTDLSISYIK